MEYRRFNINKDKDILEEAKSDDELNKFFEFNEKTNVAVDNDNVVGGFSLSYAGAGASELSVCVLKKYRKMGYGEKILKDLTNNCFSDNDACVFVKINKNNLPSLKLAKKCGFRLDDEREEYNSDNKEDEYYYFYKRNPNYTNGMRR